MSNFNIKLRDTWKAFRLRGEVRAVRASGLLDSETYLTQQQTKGWRKDPALHYVLYGESMGLSPSIKFDPAHYGSTNPDVARAGVNLLAHYERHGRMEGRSPLPPSALAIDEFHVLAPLFKDMSNEVDAESVRIILASGEFDTKFYSAQRDAAFSESEAIADYLRDGERSGFSPNSEFDPSYYRERYPDVSENGTNLFLHYIRYGTAEGRLANPFPDLNDQLARKINYDRQTVIVVVHETSRTGAPILGLNIATKLKYQWGYNVVVISWRGGGSLEQAFCDDVDIVIAPKDDSYMPQADIDWLARKLKLTLQPKYAIANSAVAFRLAVALARSYVPVVALVHEFSSLFGTGRLLHTYFSEVGCIVFPAEIVKESAIDIYPFVANRLNKILPQGRSVVPGGASETTVKGSSAFSTSSDILDWASDEGCFTVVGMGTVEWRKGVDLFISAAVSFRCRFPEVSCRFVWVGAQTAHSQEAVMYLREQLHRSEVANAVLLLPETSDVARVYAAADALFISSRLDPLPNVAIDAMTLGLPVISFDRATGVADLLRADADLGDLVVGYADTHAAATVVHKLATDATWLRLVKKRTTELASRLFDMNGYVAALDEIGSSLNATVAGE